MKIIICPSCGVVFDLNIRQKESFGDRIRDDDGAVRNSGVVESCPIGCYLTQEELDKAFIVMESRQ